MSALDDPEHYRRDGTCPSCGEDVSWDVRYPTNSSCQHCCYSGAEDDDI